MDKIKYVKLEQADGTYSDPIPLSIDPEVIDLSNGKNLQETIGNVDVDDDGSIEYQLKNKISKNDIEDNLESSDKNKVLSANQGKVINKKIYYFDSIAEMKNYNLKAGDMVITSRILF